MVCSLHTGHGNFLEPKQPRITVLARPAPEALKEVAPVVNIKISNRTNLTSAFGMSVCGRALSVITRDRMAATKGHVGSVPAYVPGTNAWSPPVC